MKKIFALLMMLGAALSLAQAPRAQEPGGYAHIVKVAGAIGPSTYDLITRHLSLAARGGAAVVVLEMDTPGGLYESTQQIVQAILDSPVPVVTYVSPSGAHAASAGTYILYASHIAAMAPGTNIGAATPIPLTGGGKDGAPARSDTLQHKIVNDASAYIRTLGELRGRNIEWAEKAVREAETLTASEALSKKVIESVAPDIETLLADIDGRTVKMARGATMTLKTKGLPAKSHAPDWRTRLLDVISDPNVAFLLMTLGGYGLVYELAHPGVFLPGVAGAICLLLGLFAMNVLPVNTAGLSLLLLGIALMAGEAFVPSFGALGIGGAISFAAGAVMLIDATTPGFGVDPRLIAGVTLASLGLLSVLLAVVLRGRRRAVVTGAEEILSAAGEVIRWQGGKGSVRVTGETWSAVAATPGLLLKKGDRVKVTAIDGLVLTVAPDKKHGS